MVGSASLSAHEMAGEAQDDGEEREGLICGYSSDSEHLEVQAPFGGKVGSAIARMRRRCRDHLLAGPAGGRPDDGEDCGGADASSMHRKPLEVQAQEAPPPSAWRPCICLRCSGNVAARILAKENILRAFLAVGVLLLVVVLVFLVLALALYAGLWNWADKFHYEAKLFDPVEDCRAVSMGSELPCGSPWAEPCFDRTRCLGTGPTGEKKRLSVYVHDALCSMRRSSDIVKGYRRAAVPLLWVEGEESFRKTAAKRGLLVQTPDEACVVVYAIPQNGECVSHTRTWGDGQNHLLLDFNDPSRHSHPRLDVKAMFAQSTMRPCYYRHGYDIAMPLRARKLYYGLRKIPSLDRKYFATFKGTLYLSGDGFLERTAVRDVGQTANDTGVVIVEECQDFHKENLLSWNVDLCERLQRDYDKADYDDLMNTTFALLPAGRSPATYRLGEALSAGSIPVLIHQDFVMPFPGRIPWRDFSFSFPSEQAPAIMETLRAVPRKKLAEMQATALEVYDEFFGHGMEGIVSTAVDILQERLAFRSAGR